MVLNTNVELMLYDNCIRAASHELDATNSDEEPKRNLDDNEFRYFSPRHFGLTIDTKCTHFFFTFVQVLRVTSFYGCTRRVDVMCTASFVEFLSPPFPYFFLSFIYTYIYLFLFLYRRSNALVKFRFPLLAQHTWKYNRTEHNAFYWQPY